MYSTWANNFNILQSTLSLTFITHPLRTSPFFSHCVILDTKQVPMRNIIFITSNLLDYLHFCTQFRFRIRTTLHQHYTFPSLLQGSSASHLFKTSHHHIPPFLTEAATKRFERAHQLFLSFQHLKHCISDRIFVPWFSIHIIFFHGNESAKSNGVNSTGSSRSEYSDVTLLEKNHRTCFIQSKLLGIRADVFLLSKTLFDQWLLVLP